MVWVCLHASTHCLRTRRIFSRNSGASLAVPTWMRRSRKVAIWTFRSQITWNWRHSKLNLQDSKVENSITRAWCYLVMDLMFQYFLGKKTLIFFLHLKNPNKTFRPSSSGIFKMKTRNPPFQNMGWEVGIHSLLIPTSRISTYLLP